MSGDNVVLIGLGLLTLFGAIFGPYLQYRNSKRRAPLDADESISSSAKSIIEGGQVVNEMLVAQLDRMAKEMQNLRREADEGKVVNGKGIPEPAGPVIYEKLQAIEATLGAAISIMQIRQRAMLQAVEYPVFEADGNGNMVWVNKASSRFTGASESDLLQNGWVNLIHPDDQEMVYRNWRNSIEFGVPYSTHFRCMTAKGDYVEVYGSGHPIHDASGKMIALLGFITLEGSDYDAAVTEVLQQVHVLDAKIGTVADSLAEFKEQNAKAVDHVNEIFDIAEKNRIAIQNAGVDGLQSLPKIPGGSVTDSDTL